MIYTWRYYRTTSSALLLESSIHMREKSSFFSCVCICRISPASSFQRRIFSILTRFSFFTFHHIYSTIRRICLFLHSFNTILNFHEAIRSTGQGSVNFHKTGIHVPMLARASSDIDQKTSTMYSFSCQ